MAKINSKKKNYPLSTDPREGPSAIKYPKNLKPERMPKPTDVGPNKYMIPVDYALQKDVDAVDTELTNRLKGLQNIVDYNNRDFKAWLTNNSTHLDTLIGRVNSLTYKFYTFVGLTVVVSVVINLYNWFN